ncbi:hypothetical protein [Vreelandella salicampi]|uniref:Uncharacterized protein n=1 Tax=Vreelandella salicampi TaxID=1449798 RepID=A0A7Z0LPD5_9GAMM|nr:hypothetical protein [Halomonas salicampi]NYS62626.1 hypothetical protein [Halomonas salicampi]
MTEAQIQELFERLGRLVSATKEHHGEGAAWDYTLPNGETHSYIIRGVKSHEAIQDSVFNLLIWIWNTKDYLKARASALGVTKKMVEDAVNSHAGLTVCADLANRLKHGRLDRESRSGLNPYLGNVSFHVPQSAMGALIFRAFEVEMDVNDSSRIELRLPILDDKGDEISDAFECAAHAIKALESIHDKIEHSV